MAKVRLTTPISGEVAKGLKVGDKVLVSGTVYTARDRAHRFLAREVSSEALPFSLRRAIIYHCGPLMRKSGSNYEIVSAGPTTSARMNIYAPEIIARYGLAAFIGKGGMGEETARAFEKYSALYLAAIGGAGVTLAKHIRRIVGNYKLEEFGLTECIWILEVKDLPTLVAMDCSGENLYEKVRSKSEEKLRKMLDL